MLYLPEGQEGRDLRFVREVRQDKDKELEATYE